MIDLLKNIDTRLFLIINGHHCAWCDTFFFLASEKLTWLPFYFFLVVVIYKKHQNELWKILVTIALIIFFTDEVSVFLKEHVMRYRPCYNAMLQPQIHLINGVCGGQYGFVSSHAANSSGPAVFLLLYFRNKIKWMIPLILFWCLTISYSRIYLGVHYPLDVLGGWITGSFFGALMYYFYNRFVSQKNHTTT